MTIVTIKNLSSGLRSFQNTQRQTKTFKPGETKTIDVAPSLASLLEREAKKTNATVAITMSEEERDDYEAEMKEIGKVNRAARVGKAARIPGRSVPPKERMAVVDRRFFTDPATVKAEEAAAAKVERDAEEEAEAVRLAVEAGSKKKKAEAETEPAPKAKVEPDPKKGKPKVERVALKKKKEE